MPDNPNSNRTWASFRVIGKHLNPQEITDSLNLKPDESFKPGDTRGTQGKTWRHGYWEITTQDNIVSTDLEEHIRNLLEKLEPVKEKVIALTKKPEIQCDVFCFWESLTKQGGLLFSPAVLGRLANLNLALGIDIYLTHESEDSE